MNKMMYLLMLLFLTQQITFAQETEKSALEKAKEAEDYGDIEMALKWYKKASELNPKNGTTYYDITWCQNELGLYEDAVKTATKGIKTSTNAKLLYEFGYAYYKLGNYKEAIIKYKNALSVDANEHSALKGIADVYFDNKEFSKAKDYYEQCLDKSKDVSFSNYRLGYIMNEETNYQKAVDYELASLKLDSEYAPAYNELAYAYSQLNKKSMALDNYIKASNLNPKNAIYLSNVGDLYYGVKELEDLDKSLEYYKKSFAIENNNAITNYRIAWILNEKEAYSEAKPYLYKAVEIDPKFADAWIELGWIDYSEKNYSAAESDYYKALQYDSKSDLVRYYLGQVFIKQKKTKKVKKMLEELKSMNSQYAEKLEKML